MNPPGTDAFALNPAAYGIQTREDLRKLRKGAVVLRFKVRLRDGRTITSRRTYHPCTVRRA